MSDEGMPRRKKTISEPTIETDSQGTRRKRTLSDTNSQSEASVHSSPVKHGVRFQSDEAVTNVKQTPVTPANQVQVMHTQGHLEEFTAEPVTSQEETGPPPSTSDVAFYLAFLITFASVILVFLFSLSTAWKIQKEVAWYIAQDTKDVGHVETILDWWDEDINETPCADPEGMGISVVLIHSSRPDLLLEVLLPALVTYPRIHEVVVSHAVKESSPQVLTFKHPKVKHMMDFADVRLLDLGRAARFKVAQTAASCDWVLFLDEDVLPTHTGLKALLAEFENNPRRVVGKWGSSSWMPPFFEPLTGCNTGNCEVIDTKLLLVRKSAISHFFRVVQRYGLQQGFKGTHNWQGADIMFALAHRLVYGQNNYALPYLEVVHLTRSQAARPWRTIASLLHGPDSWYERSVVWGVCAQLVKRLDKAPRDLLQITKGHRHGTAMEGSERDTHFITFASNLKNGFLPSLQAELKKYEVPFHIIHTTQYPGPAMHTQQILGQACSLPPQTVVVKVDAYDTIISGDPRDIAARFRETGALFVAGWMQPVVDSQHFYKALWGWPEQSQCKQDNHSQPFLLNRYLCSGTWLTYAHFACQLRCAYEDVNDNFASDQLVLSRIMNRFPDLIQLDCDNKFFYSIKPPPTDSLSSIFQYGREGAGKARASFLAYLQAFQQQGIHAPVTHFIDCTPIDGLKNPGCDPSEHLKKISKFFNIVMTGRVYAVEAHARVTRQMELCLDQIYSARINPSSFHVDAMAKRDLMKHERAHNHSANYRYPRARAANTQEDTGEQTAVPGSEGRAAEARVATGNDTLPSKVEGGSGLLGLKVVVVNERSRLDRLDSTIAVLNRLGVPPEDWEVVRPTPAGIACALLEYMGFDNVARFSDNKCSLVHTYVRIWQDMNSSEHAQDPLHYAILQDDVIEAVSANKMRAVLRAALSAAPSFHVLHLEPCADWCFLQQDHGSWKTMHMPHCLGAAIFRRDTAVELPSIIKHTPASDLASMLSAHPNVRKLGTPFPLFEQYTLGLSSDLYGVRASWLQQQLSWLFPQYACAEYSWKAMIVLVLLLSLLAASLVMQVDWLRERLVFVPYLASLTIEPSFRPHRLSSSATHPPAPHLHKAKSSELDLSAAVPRSLHSHDDATPPRKRL
eukprot:g57206.t1